MGSVAHSHLPGPGRACLSLPRRLSHRDHLSRFIHRPRILTTPPQNPKTDPRGTEEVQLPEDMNRRRYESRRFIAAGFDPRRFISYRIFDLANSRGRSQQGDAPGSGLRVQGLGLPQTLPPRPVNTMHVLTQKTCPSEVFLQRGAGDMRIPL